MKVTDHCVFQAGMGPRQTFCIKQTNFNRPILITFLYFQVAIDGVRGSHWAGDIAIDDIVAYTGFCSSDMLGEIYIMFDAYWDKLPSSVAVGMNLRMKHDKKNLLKK